jgi:2-polyprenyl-3-methyl-5-hydroxy-6-metoxy-1,4-benzoquinol methylase
MIPMSTPTQDVDRQIGADRPRCPACDQDGEYWDTKDGYAIARCGGCGCGFVWPRPDAKILIEHYRNQEARYARSPTAARYRDEMPADCEPKVVLADLLKLGVRRGRLLDVGAGKGRFSVAFARAGFDVTALEPDPAYAERLRNLPHVGVVESTFEAWEPGRPPEPLFDVVNMGQVLEHVHSPSLWVSKASRLLKPGGVLAVATPNFGSLLTLILRKREGHICPPEHVNFYTRDAIRKLISRAGLAVIRGRTRSLITVRLCVAAVRERIRWARSRPVAEIAGHAVWISLLLADCCGRGRYFHIYSRRVEPGRDSRRDLKDRIIQGAGKVPVTTRQWRK